MAKAKRIDETTDAKRVRLHKMNDLMHKLGKETIDEADCDQLDAMIIVIGQQLKMMGQEVP